MQVEVMHASGSGGRSIYIHIHYCRSPSLYYMYHKLHVFQITVYKYYYIGCTSHVCCMHTLYSLLELPFVLFVYAIKSKRHRKC